jgi:hypothetical protein
MKRKMLIGAALVAAVPAFGQAVEKVPAAVAVDRQENGTLSRYYFHEVPGSAFRYRSLSQAEWHLVWSALHRNRAAPFSVRYECQLDGEGRYAGSPACRAYCDGDQDERACRAVGQRYFDRAFDKFPEMPKDQAPDRAYRRHAAFQMMFAPGSRPAIDFDLGEEASFSHIVSNYNKVMRRSARLMPLRFLGGTRSETTLTVQCKVQPDRSIACRRVAIFPEAAALDFDGVAEAFAITAEPVSRLPDGRDPVGMRFTQVLRFKLED